jgi:hypothetical protein
MSDKPEEPKSLEDSINEIKEYTSQIRNFNSILERHKQDLK